MFGLIHHLTGVVVIPVEVEDAALAQQVVMALGVRKRSKNGELGQVKVNLTQKVDEALDVVLGLVVEPEKDGAFHPNAIVMIALHTLLDVVGGVVNGLIHIPGARLGGQVENFGVVLNGVADPFLLQRGDGTEEVHLPLLVLRQ